jgi:hypothetical protein
LAMLSAVGFGLLGVRIEPYKDNNNSRNRFHRATIAVPTQDF